LKDNLVSVLLPVWKPKPELLSISIKSILEQTFTNLELLIIYQKTHDKNDNEIKEVFEENSDDHRLKIIQVKEKGLSNSLNAGLTQSSGQLIARMDSDDVSEKNRLDEQTSFINETGNDLIGSWAYLISENGDVIGTAEPPALYSEIRKKIMFHNPFLHPSILFRKKIIEKVGVYSSGYNSAEDYDFYFRIIAANFKVANIPKFLIRLRETEDSIMRGRNWLPKRWINFKVKGNAVKNLGFTSPRDLFYDFLTPLTLLVSPKRAFYLKEKIGYTKKKN